MYDHYFSNFGRTPVPDDLCKDSATKHPPFKKIFKGFYHIWAWRPLVVGHRLEIIIDHRLASVAAADAIFRL